MGVTGVWISGGEDPERGPGRRMCFQQAALEGSGRTQSHSSGPGIRFLPPPPPACTPPAVLQGPAQRFDLPALRILRKGKKGAHSWIWRKWTRGDRRKRGGRREDGGWLGEACQPLALVWVRETQADQRSSHKAPSAASMSIDYDLCPRKISGEAWWCPSKEVLLCPVTNLFSSPASRTIHTVCKQGDWSSNWLKWFAQGHLDTHGF